MWVTETIAGKPSGRWWQAGPPSAAHLLLHACLQEQHDAGFDGQGDLTATPL